MLNSARDKAPSVRSKKLVLPAPESQSNNSVAKQQRSQTEEQYGS